MKKYENFDVIRSEGSLANGVKVALFYKAGAPISTYAVFKSGSRYDPSNMPGVAHFIEHMIVNGSPEFPSKDLLAEHIESIGGSYSAFTSSDVMAVETQVPEKSDYSRVVDIYRATLCNPLMNEKVFENEKNIVIKEINKSNSNPQALLGKTSRKNFFQGTVYEHAVLGDESAISSLAYEDVMRQHKILLDGSRLTFIVGGDIELSEVIEYLNKLELFNSNRFDQEGFLGQVVGGNKILATNFDTQQTHLHFGVLSPPPFSRESMHLAILGTILAGGRSSRLTKRLRYKHGLVYGVGITRSGGELLDSWVISTDTTTDKVQTVIDEIIAEIKLLHQDGVLESELEFAKNRRVKSLKIMMQTAQSWVNFHFASEIYPEKGYDLDAYIKYVNETTTQDVKDVIHKYLKPDNWKLSLVGRNKEEEVKISW